MANEKKIERIPVWLTREQLAWLKTKKNASETMRALVNEAMNLDRLAQSLRRGARRRPKRADRRR